MILNSNLPKLTVDEFIDILFKRRSECFDIIKNSPNSSSASLAKSDYETLNSVIQLAHRLERGDDRG